MKTHSYAVGFVFSLKRQKQSFCKYQAKYKTKPCLSMIVVFIVGCPKWDQQLQGANPTSLF